MDNIAEILRRIENMIRYGTIAEVDHANALVRVKYATDHDNNDILTDWRPWLTHAAASNRTWRSPEIGEQVALLSPSGNLSLALILPAIYQAAHTAPSSSASAHVTHYSDGTVVTYDTTDHKLTVDVAGGDVLINTDTHTTVNAGGNVAITAAGVATVDAPEIKLNNGAGVVTQECICLFTGTPHSDGSATVKAGK
jgi:phage baseplate assembly protein V